MPPPQVVTVMALTSVARQYPASALPVGFHQSYPIPVRAGTKLRAGFLYCAAEIIKPGEGLQLRTPSYIAFLNAETGEFEEFKVVEPGDYGQKHAEGEIIGRYLTLPERLLPEFLTRQVRLYQAYDKLLPAFAAGPPAVAPEVKKAAAEFKALFPQVAESPLMPYYQAIGKEFFAWLNKLNP